MYLQASEPVIAELAVYVAPGGFLALAARTTTSALWRPAARQDWPATLAALDEHDLALAEGRDVRYLDEIGGRHVPTTSTYSPAPRPRMDWCWSSGTAYGSPSTRRNSTRHRRLIPGTGRSPGRRRTPGRHRPVPAVGPSLRT